MASAGVLPWLVGLPANDTTWDAAPPPTTDTRNAVSIAGSPKSEPGTLRSRLSDAMDGTVNIRAQSNSPAKQQSLAWKKRLINGDMSYGDQTDLFGPSALENIFTRNQASDSGSQKKHSQLGLKHRLSMDQRAENTNPATAKQRHGFDMFMPSSPPPPAHATTEKRIDENSPGCSPASHLSQSSVADMLSDMMGKIDELSDSNKSYQSRMQSLKDRLGDSEEWQQKPGNNESEETYARSSAISPKGQAGRRSTELLDSKRKSFEQAEQSFNPEKSADWTQSERDQTLENGDTSNEGRHHTRQNSDGWRHRREGEDAQSALGSSRSASPQPAEFDTEADSPRSEIVSRQPRESTVHSHGNYQTSFDDGHANSDSNYTEAGAGRNTDDTTHLAPSSRNVTGNLSATDSELEDLTPVFLEKRTTSTGGVQFNAVRTDHVTRADILKQRRAIDKTETSQRAREAELAMDEEESEESGIADREHSTPNRPRTNDHMGSTETSVIGPDDSELLEARHVSGFTDAPEVEEDMPIRTKQAAFSTDWDFSEPPQNESSELIAAHKRGESEHKWSVSFGARQLDDYSFRVADRALEDTTENTVDGNDGAQPSELNESYSKSPSLPSSSPSSDVPAPGSRMPFEFRKDSIPPVETATAKARRITSRGSVLGSARAANLTLPKTRSSPVQASAEPEKRDVVSTKTRSPPQVYIEDTDGAFEFSSVIEGKRPLPRSPLVSPTPKRRRTLHNSELQSMSDANVSYHSQLQEALTGGKRKDARQSEKRNSAPPDILAHRKIARPRNSTPTQGPATKDYINEAKKVIELLRGNVNKSILLGGITEAEEDDETYEDYEDEGEDDEGEDDEGAADEDGDDEARYGTYNTHKSDNMRTLAPQQVAHLIGGEVHGMTFDRSKNCWIRSKSFEHKQFLDPRDALSSDDDPFREISDLTVERPIRVHVTHPSQELEATTIVHHELDGTGLSYDDTGLESDVEREDSPQRTQKSGHENPKLPGEETTLAHYNDEHESDDSEVTPTMDVSIPTPPPKQCTAVPAEVARLQVATTNPNANINNTFLLSDLPDFTVNEEDHERPSERALATRLASYAAVEAGDPYTVATTELVKAITDVQGREIYWSDLTSLSLHNKSLKSLHNLGEHCARIEKLDVSSNALTQLDGVPMFVRELNARSNQLVSLTSWTHLMHLQYLDISSNGMESLDGLGHLIHLRELRVDNNRIRRLDGIADLDGLISLSARKNSIRELDFEHFRFGRVVELDVSENQITSIQGLEGLSSLRTLKLDNNQLGDSLVVTSPMPRLRHLSLRSCGLESLDVTNFPNLRTLEVDNNRLTNITGLSTLKKLDLLSMCGQTLPEDHRIEIFQNPIEAQTIRLSRNTIPDLQITIPFMTVKHLSLSDTGLSSIPTNFGLQFPNLRSLDLSYNGLKDIRPLAPLGALETLNLTGCRVERLRKTVATLGKLQKLRKLDLKSNPLTQGFYGPRCEVAVSDSSRTSAVAEEDRIYRSKLDEDTAMRRRTYELLLAYSCCPKDGFELDGLVFNRKAAVAKDEVWERLVELGVLRRVD